MCLLTSHDVSTPLKKTRFAHGISAYTRVIVGFRFHLSTAIVFVFIRERRTIIE